MALTKERIFNNAQIEYLNKAYAPKTVDDYMTIWESDGKVQIANWIDLSLESEESIESLLTLYILYVSHSLHPSSENMRINLTETLKSVQKRQLRDKQKVSGKAIFKGNTESEFKEVKW